MKLAIIITIALAFGCQSGTPAKLPDGCPNWPNSTGDVRPIYRVPHRYPAAEYRRGIEGYVEIDAKIGRDGTVLSAKVARSVPPGVFDKTALRAYRRWRYCPLLDGAPDYPDPTTVRLIFNP